MRENLFKRLSQLELLSLADNVIDEFMALIESNDKDTMEKKRNELCLLNKIIKEKELKNLANPS